MTQGSAPLDPVAIASREFVTARKGFDKDEVRAYLRALSDSVRTLEKSSASSQELAEAKRSIERLQAERDELEARIAELEAASGNGPAPAPELDDATVMQFLGEETARVLEAARSAAAEIRRKADTEASELRAEAERAKADAETEAADLRRTVAEQATEERDRAQTEADELRRNAEEEAARLTRDAGARADEQLAEAEAKSAELINDAEAAAAEVRAKADTDAAERRAEADADATRIAAEASDARDALLAAAREAQAAAETEAARIRAEADADAITSQEAAAETARLMVTEAQDTREKVLSDLVSRRRLGRQQIDQAKAARDRLHQALVAVRSELDAQLAELELSVPEAKAAMEAIARSTPSSDDAAQVAALEAELDAGSAERIELPEEVPHVTAGAAALSSLGAGAAPADDTAADDTATDDTAADDTGASTAGETEPDREEPVTGSVFERLRAADRTADESDAATAGTGDAGDEAADDEQIDVPEAFVARDVAMTRHGADLRRKIKRAMADDQSDILDRLRRAKKMSVDDLPSIDAQRAAYLGAIQPALVAAARAGAEMSGGSVDPSVVDDLVERVMSAIFDPLRSRVQQSVESAEGDAEEVLEPIRAHYRDLRSSEVPAVTDDALAEAFAIGAYEALDDGVEIAWIADPRMEPSSDCYDNTLGGAIHKPEEFPTGSRRPGGEPGCRCLVVAVA